MDSQPTVRKPRNTSAKRRDILSGAVTVFTEKGYEAASMDRIAEVAGVSKRTVYNHFPSKEALFQAIVADFLAASNSVRPASYDPAMALETQLRLFIEAEMFLINDAARRGLSRLLTATFLIDPGFGARTHAQHTPHAELVVWLQAATQDGRLDVPLPELAARLFYGMVEGCLTWPALMSDGASLADAAAVTDELVAAFIRHYA